MKTRLAPLALSLCLLACSNQASGQGLVISRFTGPSGNWFESSRWLNGVVSLYIPDDGNLYQTQIGANFSVEIDGPGAFAGSLFLGLPPVLGSSAGPGKLTVGTNGVLTVNYLLPGHTDGATGTLVVSGGGDVTVNEESNIGFRGEGHVTVTGAGSTFTQNGTKASVGSDASGFLTVSDNALATFNTGLLVGNGNSVQGTVLVNNGGVLATTFVEERSSNGSFTLDGGTLRALGSSPDFLRNITPGHFTLGAAGGTIDTQFHTIIVDDEMAGSGALVKVGTGELKLASSNTYEGGTILREGTVRISSDANLGKAGTRLTFDGGLLTTTGQVTIDRPITITPAGGTILTNIDIVPPTILKGNISGSGTLTKAGIAVDLHLTGDNASFSGNIHVQDGTVVAGSNTALGTGTVVLENGSRLGLAGEITVGTAVSLAGTGVIENSGSGATAYAGTVALNGQTLRLVGGAGSGNSLTFSGSTTGTGALRLQNSAGTTILVTGDGLNHAGTITNFGVSNVTKISGAIGANVTGVLQSSSSSKLILAGDNLYAADTTVTAGTLQIGDGGTNGSVAGNIVNNDSLIFNRSNSHTYAKVISGTGSLEQAGAGMLVLTGTNTYTGATLVSSGTLQFGDGGSLSALSTGSVTNNATLAFNHSASSAAGNAISGSGTVIKLGSGTLTYAGQSTGQTWNLKGGNLTVGGDTSGQIGFGVVSGQAGRTAVTVDSSGLDLTVAANGTVAGGFGGDFPVGTGLGAAGGAGVIYGGSGAVSNAGTISGGKGGNGGPDSGSGGNGGQAMTFSTIASLNNTGSILGGAGGSVTGSGVDQGGNGGIAISLAQGGSLVNSGTIFGGSGGLGGVGSPDAQGGAAIVTAAGGTQIVNSGLIWGGLSSTGVRATAISFAGNDNRLELRAGSVILGNVIASGTGDQLVLGGSSNSTFDFGKVGTQYHGFESVAKTGASVWSVAGTLGVAAPVSISGGSLDLQNATVTGAVDVLAGGTLAGRGTVSGNTSVLGTLAPGSGGAGLLAFGGNLTLQPSATVLLEIGGTGAALFDHIGVGGDLAYGGALTLSLLGGYVPEVGDSFQLFDGFQSQSGSFTQIVFSDAAIQGTLDYSTGMLSIVAVPEPSSGLLAGFGLLFLVTQVLKKRRINVCRLPLLALGLSFLISTPGIAEEPPTQIPNSMTPKIGPVIPILPVRDLGRSIDFYTKTLGFKLDWGAKEDTVCSVSRDKWAIMLQVRDKIDTPSWVWIGTDAALFDTFRAAGVKVFQEPKNHAWAYEMKFEDIDGNILWLGSDPRKDMPFEDAKKD